MAKAARRDAYLASSEAALAQASDPLGAPASEPPERDPLLEEIRLLRMETQSIRKAYHEATHVGIPRSVFRWVASIIFVVVITMAVLLLLTQGRTLGDSVLIVAMLSGLNAVLLAFLIVK